MRTQRSSQFNGGFGGDKSGGEDSVTDGFTEEGPRKRKSRYFVVTGSQFDIQHCQVQLQRWGQVLNLLKPKFLYFKIRTIIRPATECFQGLNMKFPV